MVSVLVLVLFVCSTAVTTVSAAPQHAPRATLDDVRFLLWTWSNPGDGDYQVLRKGYQDSLGSFNGRDPTVVLIHGFMNYGYEGWPVEAKTELLKFGPYNVISVEWGKLTVAPWYPSAVYYVPGVGALTARLLDWLHEEAAMDPAGVQVVGHSLGAHVSGAVGQYLMKFRLPSITGMDPSGPQFYSKPNSLRLDKTDAEFVQIIHTNGGGILEGCVGLRDQVGHVDFYANGGEHQPGCTVGGDLMDLLTGGCSHEKSHMYWVESINGDPTFVSRPCSDWETYQAGKCTSCGQGCLEMGFHVDKSLEGAYYLATNENNPFALGDQISPRR